MPDLSTNLKNGVVGTLLKFFSRTLPLVFLSLVFFAGGIVLLLSRLPGWSLFLGLPATQIGIILLILTFDDIARKKFGPENLCVVSCSICGRPTPTPCGQKEDICADCQKKITKKGKEEKT